MECAFLKHTLCFQIKRVFTEVASPSIAATKVSAATLLNAFKTIERRVATLMKTGCTRTASCLSVTGHGAPLCQCATLCNSVQQHKCRCAGARQEQTEKKKKKEPLPHLCHCRGDDNDDANYDME